MAYGGPDNLEEVEPYLMDVRGYRATSSEISPLRRSSSNSACGGPAT